MAKKARKEQYVVLMDISRSEIESSLGRKMTNGEWRDAKENLSDYFDWDDLDQSLARAVTEWKEGLEDIEEVNQEDSERVDRLEALKTGGKRK